eukprot:scaffold1790_cov257-Pinguiococcus_pyrenoidosus.AAC.54
MAQDRKRIWSLTPDALALGEASRLLSLRRSFRQREASEHPYSQRGYYDDNKRSELVQEPQIALPDEAEGVPMKPRITPTEGIRYGNDSTATLRIEYRLRREAIANMLLVKTMNGSSVTPKIAGTCGRTTLGEVGREIFRARPGNTYAVHREDHVAELDAEKHDEQRRRQPCPVLQDGEEPITVVFVRALEEAVRELDDGVVAEILLFVILHPGENLVRAEQQDRREDQENLPELRHGELPERDERPAHDHRSPDAVAQHLALQLRRHLEILKEQQKHEEIVHAQGLLQQIARHELYSPLLTHRASDARSEQKRPANRDARPGPVNLSQSILTLLCRRVPRLLRLQAPPNGRGGRPEGLRRPKKRRLRRHAASQWRPEAATGRRETGQHKESEGAHRGALLPSFVATWGRTETTVAASDRCSSPTETPVAGQTSKPKRTEANLGRTEASLGRMEAGHERDRQVKVDPERQRRLRRSSAAG